MPERYLGHTMGKYRVESLLGSGGFAWVFKGYDPELDIPVAIKVLKPQFAGDEKLVERFRREASTAAKLRHPNIIKIYAVGSEADAVYFVMDYLPGGLADKLEATSSLPEDYVIRIGIDVARALGFAHREGVIHRDIKVDNILFDSHGNAVVADFGIARAVSGYTQQTGTNMVVGTPQYFAPEQARARPLDGRADIYSLGVTLYRSSTGRLPFEGDDWYEIARQHVEEPPPAPRSVAPGLSLEFEHLLLRCLAKPPDERPATGEQMAEELDSILAFRRDPTASRTLTVPAIGGPTIIAPIGGTKTPLFTRIRRAKFLVPGAFAAVAIAALLVTLVARPFDASPVDSMAAGKDTTAPDSSPMVTFDTGGAVRPDSTKPVNTKGTPPAGAARAVLIVKAPEGTTVTLKLTDSTTASEIALGIGSTLRHDSLPPGRYAVTGTLPSIEGCNWARDQKFVNLRSVPSPSSVTLTPRLCGSMEITARFNPGAGEVKYEVTSTTESSLTRTGTLPSSTQLVLPVGAYRVVVTKPRCQNYDETLTINPADVQRVVATLFCP